MQVQAILDCMILHVSWKRWTQCLMIFSGFTWLYMLFLRWTHTCSQPWCSLAVSGASTQRLTRTSASSQQTWTCMTGPQNHQKPANQTAGAASFQRQQHVMWWSRKQSASLIQDFRGSLWKRDFLFCRIERAVLIVVHVKLRKFQMARRSSKVSHPCQGRAPSLPIHSTHSHTHRTNMYQPSNAEMRIWTSPNIVNPCSPSPCIRQHSTKFTLSNLFKHLKYYHHMLSRPIKCSLAGTFWTPHELWKATSTWQLCSEQSLDWLFHCGTNHEYEQVNESLILFYNLQLDTENRYTRIR